MTAIFFLPAGLIEERRVGWWDLIGFLLRESRRDTLRFDGATFRKFFKPAQFGNDHQRIRDVAFVVEKNINLAVTFKPRDWVDDNFLHTHLLCHRGHREHRENMSF